MEKSVDRSIPPWCSCIDWANAGFTARKVLVVKSACARPSYCLIKHHLPASRLPSACCAP